MNNAIRIIGFILAGLGLVFASGCATSQPPTPLSYVALSRPTGVIKAPGRMVETKHSKNGVYFLNFGFRPAADVGAYIEKAQVDSGADVLRSTDIQLAVPFAFDILLFGFQFGSDTVKANQYAYEPVVAPISNEPEITPAAQTEAPVDNIEDNLKTLKELKDGGIMTQEEYDAKKKALLEKY